MENKKNAILRMVLQFLWSNEVAEKLTIANIAKRMDMGKSTLYEYFENKDQMLLEAINLMIDENLSSLLNVDNFDEKPFKEAFTEHMYRSFKIASQNQMVQHVIESMDYVTMAKAYKDEIMLKMFDAYKQSKARMGEILQKGIDEGIIEERLSAMRIETIESMLIGAVFSWSNPLNDWDEEQLIKALYDSLLTLHR